MADDARRPVLAGVGVSANQGPDSVSGLEALELMAEAALCAGADSGSRSILEAVDTIATPRGTWSYVDLGRMIASRIGASKVRTVVAEVGISQQSLVNAALGRIRSGDCEVVLVVGGEARRRAAVAARSGVPAPETTDVLARPDVVLAPADEIVAGPELAAGLADAVRQYAIIDNALRHAEGRSVEEHLDDVARLWSAFNAVAGTNPRAAFPAPMTSAQLRTPGPGNRPLAFPYAKWHSTQWTVDQAAALLFCSERVAARHGVDRDRCLYPLVALESSHAVPLARRAELHRWPAMRLLGEAAELHLGEPLTAIEHVELYSCFPVAVRVQQRELGLATEACPTITGGMAFAGGPFNNFSLQATAAMVERLRADRGARGMVTTVSGLLTKPGLMVWSTDPRPSPAALIADVAPAARAATRQRSLVSSHHGRATVAGYTVTYEDHRPARTIVVADADEGMRLVATSDDRELAARATTAELIGHEISVEGITFVGPEHWR